MIGPPHRPRMLSSDAPHGKLNDSSILYPDVAPTCRPLPLAPHLTSSTYDPPSKNPSLVFAASDDVNTISLRRGFGTSRVRGRIRGSFSSSSGYHRAERERVRTE
jgi:hypothetical protein